MNVREMEMTVVEVAERRIVDCFNKNEVVALAFSGGKDSICTADMVVKTMQKHNIPFSRLFVYFVDEEAIYPDIEEITMMWRKKFLALGSKFYWFCMPFKHYNCCNRLADDESFILWEPGKEDRWVRKMPSFAIKNHKDFKWGMTYQTFLNKVFKDVSQICGCRMFESIQRAYYMTRRKEFNKKCYPIYDWHDSDVWLYIRDNDLYYPMSYIYMYKTGVPLTRMRISQFFSIDTIKVLPKVLEYYPDLFQRIVRREPNADLVLLYYDTDMFRSGKQDTAFDVKKDFKKLLFETFADAVKHPNDYPGFEVVKCKLATVLGDFEYSDKVYKHAYQILIAGDPKLRSTRVLYGMCKTEQLNQGLAYQQEITD